MIKPVNNHILIEPVKSDSFIPTDKGIYEEIGVVIDNGYRWMIEDLRKQLDREPVAEEICEQWGLKLEEVTRVNIGDRVYFDSWLAARYPTGKGDEFFWLVKWSDIRAVENGNPIPK